MVRGFPCEEMTPEEFPQWPLILVQKSISVWGTEKYIQRKSRKKITEIILKIMPVSMSINIFLT